MVGIKGFGAIALAASLVCRPLAAQTDEELQAARTLFLDAVKDEDEQRFDVAYEKFRQVQRVRDTVNVRYNLARCLEGMGKIASAFEMYEAATQLAGQDGSHAEAVNESMRRSAQLVKRIPYLAVALPPTAANVVVRFDDTPVPVERARKGHPVDPGRHTISIKVDDRERYFTSISVREGEQATIVVPPEAISQDGLSLKVDPVAPPVAPPPLARAEKGPSRTPWAISTAGGGALVLTSAVLLFAYYQDVTTLKERCPNGRCPPGEDANELSAIESRGKLLGSLGLGAGVLGAGALSLGIYMLTRPDHPTKAPTTGLQLVPAMNAHGGSCVLRGMF